MSVYIWILLHKNPDVDLFYWPTYWHDVSHSICDISRDIFSNPYNQCKLTNQDLVQIRCTLRGDKVSMLAYTCLYKSFRKIKLPSAIIKLTAHFTCSLMSTLMICKYRKEYGHAWHWMSILRPGVSTHKTQTLCRTLLTFQLITWISS